MNADFTTNEENSISEICEKIKHNDFKKAFSLLENLMKEIQKRELEEFLKEKENLIFK